MDFSIQCSRLLKFKIEYTQKIWTILFKCGQYCPHFLDICLNILSFTTIQKTFLGILFFISFTMSNVKISMVISCSRVTLNIKESLRNGLLMGNLKYTQMFSTNFTISFIYSIYKIIRYCFCQLPLIQSQVQKKQSNQNFKYKKKKHIAEYKNNKCVSKHKTIFW